MTNPYPAVVQDQNGETRVAGQVNFTDPANRPSTAFNGGTITTPLEIDNPGTGATLTLKSRNAVSGVVVDSGGVVTINPDPGGTPTDDSLVVHAQSGDASATPVRIFDRNGDLVWSMGRDGDITATASETRGNMTLGAGGDAFFKGPAASTSLIAWAPDGATDVAQFANAAGVVGTRFNFVGAFITAVHAAPADADLLDGECALWFDQTNGAAKLMLKGKTANGTVVAAAIALA